MRIRSVSAGENIETAARCMGPRGARIGRSVGSARIHHDVNRSQPGLSFLKSPTWRLGKPALLSLVLLACALFYSPKTKCDGEQCVSIAGEWQVNERGTLTCTFTAEGESETGSESFSGSARVTIFQDPGDCAVRYNPGIQGGERTGWIVGDRLTIRGLGAIPPPEVTLTKNIFEAAGQVMVNVFTLLGKGTVEGSGTEDGVTVRFVCTIQSQADFTRIPSVTLSPASQSFPATGGDGSVTVTASAGASWTAQSYASWITITSGANGSGNGTVNYRVAANSVRSQRSGTMTIGGKTFPVTQTAGTTGSVSETLFVPIILSSTGASNSFFNSELTLTNRGANPALLELTYTAAFGGGSGTSADTLLPGQQLIFPDAIEYLRSRGIPIPASGNRGGPLSVRFSGLSASSDAALTVRTTSRVPGGRAGLAYAGIPVSQALTGPAYLCGLRQNTTDRSNVAIQNAGSAQDGNVVLRLTVFSGDSPVSQRLPDETLAPGGFKQISGILGLYGLSNGYLRVERVGGRAPYYAYAVINDQFNSDGSFVPPVLESSLVGRRGFTLPVIVDSGAFSTELVLSNWSAVAKTLRLALVSDSVQMPNSTAQFQMTLNPGQQFILPRIVQYLREHNVAGLPPAGTSTVGALFATVSSGDVRGVFLGARTAAPGGGGQYGLFYPAAPYGTASTTSGWLYGLRQDAENRTNLALVNTGEVSPTANTFRIEIFDGNSGTKVSTVDGVTVGPQRWMQMNVLLARYAPGTPHAYARLTRTSGVNPFIAYAVINDGATAGERTGDGAYVAMSVDSQ